MYQNFKGINFPLEKASDSCDMCGQHVTHVTDTERVITKQRYNNFSSESIGICNQCKNVYPSATPTNRISRIEDSVKMKLLFPERMVEEFRCFKMQWKAVWP